jgi:ethanolamine ammonia-lyase small subunit
VAVVDGLSALAVERHAVPLIRALIALAPQRWAGAPMVVALQGRVALGDEIGERLGAQLVAVLIGERPGLSSPDSLGAYLTFAPCVGRTDAERNCVSNIRPEGLGYEAAARRIDWLAAAALARGLTGVALKDESAAPTPVPAPGT